VRVPTRFTTIFAIDRSDPMILRISPPSWWSICASHVLLNCRKSSRPRKTRTWWRTSSKTNSSKSSSFCEKIGR